MDHFSYSSLSIWISIIYPCPSACDSAVLPTMVGGGSFRSSTLDSRLDHWRLIYNRIQTEGRQCTAPKSIPCSLWCTMRGGFTIPFQLLPFSFDPAGNPIWSPTWASQASPRSAKSQPTHRPMSVKINIGCQASHCNSEVFVTQQNLTDTHGNTNSWTPMSINITGKKKNGLHTDSTGVITTSTATSCRKHILVASLTLTTILPGRRQASYRWKHRGSEIRNRVSRTVCGRTRIPTQVAVWLTKSKPDFFSLKELNDAQRALSHESLVHQSTSVLDSLSWMGLHKGPQGQSKVTGIKVRCPESQASQAPTQSLVLVSELLRLSGPLLVKWGHYPSPAQR